MDTMRKEMRGLMYVGEEDLGKLYAETQFYRMTPADGWQHSEDAIGIYLTRYGRLEVVLVKDKCDTCANYKPIK